MRICKNNCSALAGFSLFTHINSKRNIKEIKKKISIIILYYKNNINTILQSNLRRGSMDVPYNQQSQ